MQEFWSSDSLPVYQSTAARLHQKVQECNVMARGMSSIDSPSVRPLSSDYHALTIKRQPVGKALYGAAAQRCQTVSPTMDTGTWRTLLAQLGEDTHRTLWFQCILRCLVATPPHTQDTLDSVPRFVCLRKFTISNILRSQYKPGFLSHHVLSLSLSLSAFPLSFTGEL